jgi:hypothetical protein
LDSEGEQCANSILFGPFHRKLSPFSAAFRAISAHRYGNMLFRTRLAATAAQFGAALSGLSSVVSSISPVAIFMTRTALPITPRGASRL